MSPKGGSIPRTEERNDRGGKGALPHQPLQREYDRLAQAELDLREKTESLAVRIGKQKEELHKAQASYTAEKEREPERNGLSSDISALNKLLPPRYDEAEALRVALHRAKQKKNDLTESLAELVEKRNLLQTKRPNSLRNLSR